MMWPKFYPSQCPPEDAKAEKIEVYRLVDGEPPSEEDFLPLKVLQPSRNFHGNDCLASGLSCFTDIQEAQKQNELLFNSIAFQRKGLPKKKIAIGHSNPEKGVIKHTPSKAHFTHMTYWIKNGESVCDEFTLI